MTDPLSLATHDEELLAEITLLTELMLAANEAADGRVPPDILDRILRQSPSAREPVDAPLVPQQRSPA
jgi:hypothetical protein